VAYHDRGSIIAKHPEKVATISFADGLIDIDTATDINAYLA